MKRLVLSFCLLGLFFPVFSQQNGPEVIEFTKKDIEKSQSTLSAVADRISFVKLETVPEAFIGAASSYSCIPIPAGFIIYSGQGKEDILLFNKTGKFTTKVGRRGQGPGEYPDYYRVKYDDFNDQILVYRMSMDKVLIFSPEGRHVKTVTIDKGELRLDHLMVLDKSHWMFTCEKPLDGELNEVGILKIDHDGRVIKKYDLTDKASPGCYGNSPQRNILYRSGNEVLYSYFPFNKTLRLTAADSWAPAFVLKSPIPEGPLDLYYRDAMMKQNEFARENGTILSMVVYPDYIKIHGATPLVFNFLIDRKTGEKHSWRFDLVSKEPGLADDLAGGPPFDIRSIGIDNLAVAMIDAPKILELRDKGLLGKTYKDKVAFQEMIAMLDRTKPDDNPIIRIVHIK